MKAYLCTIGETTTEICQEQLNRFGFEVVLLSDKESWYDKYKRFINLASDSCIRIDADVIPNENVARISNEVDFLYNFYGVEPLMVQFKGYDFYKNNIGVSSPVYYSAQALQIIGANLDNINPNRPEATAWRLPEINEFTYTSEMVVGLHGFFQDGNTFDRAMQNKIDRKQIDLYDFTLAEQLRTIKYE